MIGSLSSGALIGPGAFLIALVILFVVGHLVERRERGMTSRQVRRSVREWERLKDVLP